MTAIAFPIQHASIEYGVEPDVRILDALFQQEGVLPIAGTTPLLVEALTPAAMQVRVKAGSAIVDFEYSPAAPQLDGGKRLFTLTADSLSGVPGNPGADWSTTFGAAAANPRIDRVVARVLDSNYDGSGLYGGKLGVVAGTATPGADLTNLTGAATIPDNSLLLANVLIRASATDIVASDIASTLATRKEAKAAGQLWEKVAEAGLGADAATLTISGLNLADYEEVEVVLDGVKTANTNTNTGFIGVRLNGDTGASYASQTSTHLFGTGISFLNTVTTHFLTNIVFSSLIGGFSSGIFRLVRPGSTDALKRGYIVAGMMGGNAATTAGSGWWNGAAPVTSITIVGLSSDASTASNLKAGLSAKVFGRRTITL